ncbi:MAG: FAD-binding oxidoreductase [Vicinamibacterales bacterium]
MLPHTDLVVTGHPIDVRAPDPVADAIDDVVPGIVVEPHTREGVAATLAWASKQGLSLVMRGAGSKIAWGRRPHRVDVILSTRKLNAILAHRAGDLTVSVAAGVALGELNQVMAGHGQWLALDPPFGDRATIGGLLATNDSGPHRHRFGTPRDLVIGIHLATPDGLVTKAGGQVVKNVAGYDLSKLVSGSFGELAAIVGATFKLSPLPGASSTVLVEALDSATLARIASSVASTQLEPVAFEFHARPGAPGDAPTACLLRFASLAVAVDAQVSAASACLGSLGASVRVLTGDAEVELWRRHSARLWDSSGAIVRGSWLPADLGVMLDLLEHMADGIAVEAVGRVGVGSGLIRLDGDVARQAAAIEQMRRSSTIGNVVLIRATRELKSAVDVWGPQSQARLLGSVKRAFDPNSVLGAGRGPLGP